MLQRVTTIRAMTLGAPLLMGLDAATAWAEPLQKLGEPEGVDDIVAWPGYIERGNTDPAFDWVTGFEQKTGCQVRIKAAGVVRCDQIELPRNSPDGFWIAYRGMGTGDG